jgi:hypothetical protein
LFIFSARKRGRGISKKGQQKNKKHQEDGLLELHAPSERHFEAFQRDHDYSQKKKRKDDPCGGYKKALPYQTLVAAAMADDADNLKRQNGKHARH